MSTGDQLQHPFATQARPMKFLSIHQLISHSNQTRIGFGDKLWSVTLIIGSKWITTPGNCSVLLQLLLVVHHSSTGRESRGLGGTTLEKPTTLQLTTNNHPHYCTCTTVQHPLWLYYYHPPSHPLQRHRIKGCQLFVITLLNGNVISLPHPNQIRLQQAEGSERERGRLQRKKRHSRTKSIQLPECQQKRSTW